MRIPKMVKFQMDTFTGRSRRVQKGFTFIEIVIVLLVMGIMATMALPSLQSGLETSKLSAAAGEIAAALEYAQLAAMTTGQQVRITVDAGADSLLVERFTITGNIMAGAAQLPQADIETGGFTNMAHPTRRGEDYRIVFADEDRLNGVDIAAAVFGGGGSITFDPVGTPSDGGTVTLSLGGGTATVTVDSLTGRVTTSG